VASAPAPAPAPAGWTFLVDEGQAFSLSSPQTVRYGAGNTWEQLTVSSGTCGNLFFGGDPLPNVFKHCEVASAAAPTPAPAPAPAPEGWTFIADENQTFKVTSTQTVRYGLGNVWVQRSVTGSGTCSNTFFGSDPVPNQFKHCEVQTGSSASAPAPAPAPSPAPAPAVGSASLQWDASANTQVVGYRIYWGKASGSYQQAKGSGINAGNATSYAVQNLPGGATYYFAVTAYDASGIESTYSAEASKTLP
jgi:hypothetical protein